MSQAIKPGKAYIGCSGFVYDHWKGIFYPPNLPQPRWLEYYAEKFDTVELNVTFYRLPKQSIFEGWRKRTGKGFIFALKGSKLITHMKQLKAVNEAVREFMNRAELLKNKLGIVLWQLKPSSKINVSRLQNFIGLLRTKCPDKRHAFEFRNETWFDPQVYGLLKTAGMTFCRADWPTGLPQPGEDFPYLYIRRHGPHGQAYTGSYREPELKALTQEIKVWLGQGKDVYVYFNNDIGGYAVENALRLKEMIAGANPG